jgi:acid stress-induced BolA-like protein IbaG/YrbA
MPLLDNESVAVRAQRRESFRLSNVSSRLTRSETERLDALANKRGLQRGELIRKLILDELASAEVGIDGDPVLTEVVGVQLLLMNVLKPVATGQVMTAAVFDNIVAEIHKLKKTVARKLMQEEK